MREIRNNRQEGQSNVSGMNPTLFALPISGHGMLHANKGRAFHSLNRETHHQGIDWNTTKGGGGVSLPNINQKVLSSNLDVYTSMMSNFVVQVYGLYL